MSAKQDHNSPQDREQTASPKQIADALIRSMLGGSNIGIGTNSAPGKSSGSSDKPVGPIGETPQRKRGTAAADSFVGLSTNIIPSPLPAAPQALPIASLEIPSARQATAVELPAPGGPKLPIQVTVSTQSAVAQPQSGLAFTALLTPTNNAPEPTIAGPAPVTEPAAAQDVTAPVVQPANPQAITMTPVALAPEATQPDPKRDGGSAPARTVSADGKMKPAEGEQKDGAPRVMAAAAVSSASGDPSSGFATPFAHRVLVETPASQNSGAANETPFHAMANALRTSEPSQPAAQPMRTGTAQEIAVRINQLDSPLVDLRIVERAGQIHVDVRTPDGALQSSLRQDLGTLTSSLEKSGFHTEVFTPVSASNMRAAGSAQMSNQDDRQEQGGGFARGSHGDSSGGRQEQRQRQQQTQDAWIEELEKQS